MSNSSKIDEKFMEIALLEAKAAMALGEVPVGALVVQGGQVITSAHTCKESTHDPTAHAEMIVLRRACEKLKSWRLTGAYLYTNLEPCVMCVGAILQARVSGVIYGAKAPKGGALESVFQLGSDSRLNHQVEIYSGVLEAESSLLLKQFFKQCRGEVTV